MLERALNSRIVADYLLVDSWYAKPDFIKHSNDLGMPIIARLPNNKLIWNFKGKHKTLNSIYDSLKNIRHKQNGKHGEIHYKYFDKDNKNFLQIIAILSAYTQKKLGFMCES